MSCGIVCLENKPRSFCSFETAPKYWILDAFVGDEGCSIPSKRFLPTVVAVSFIWLKFAHSHPYLFADFKNVDVHSCHLQLEHIQFTLIHGPNIPCSYAVLFFTASDLTLPTRHIHNWRLFLLWPSLFIFSWPISLCFPRSILDTYWPGGLISGVISFCLFLLSMGFSRQGYWSGLPLLLYQYMICSKIFSLKCYNRHVQMPLCDMELNFLSRDTIYWSRDIKIKNRMTSIYMMFWLKN